MKRTTLSSLPLDHILSYSVWLFSPRWKVQITQQLISPYSEIKLNKQQPFFLFGNITESRGFQNQVSAKAIRTSIPEEVPVHSNQHGVTNIPANGRYYRLVVLLGEKNPPGSQGDWSLVDLATILPPIPAAPLPLSPAALSFTNNQTPTFSWGSVPYGNSYDFEISTDAAFSKLVSSARVDSSAEKQIEFKLTEPLSPDGWYYWRVRAKNTDGISGAWSTAIKFAWIPIRHPSRYDLPVENAATLSTPCSPGKLGVANSYQFEYAIDIEFLRNQYPPTPRC